MSTQEKVSRAMSHISPPATRYIPGIWPFSDSASQSQIRERSFFKTHTCTCSQYASDSTIEAVLLFEYPQPIITVSITISRWGCHVNCFKKIKFVLENQFASRKLPDSPFNFQVSVPPQRTIWKIPKLKRMSRSMSVELRNKISTRC